MTRTSTLLWRGAVLGMFLAVVPVAVLTYERQVAVDTGAMLDVSVSIRTVSHVRIDEVGDSVWESGTGSGFLVSAAQCEVWTNHHVIEDAAIVEVFPRGWNRAAGIPARVVNSTPRSDVAVLRMEHCDGVPAARFGDSDDVAAGDETFAVGNPLGRNPDSISRGIISHEERFVAGPTPYLQTDAAINPGNSGGALFNRDGEVVGMSTAIAAGGDGRNVGIGYAVPINLVRQVAARLREGPPSWGDAGIASIVSSLTPDEAELFNVPRGRAAIIVTRDPGEGPAAGRLEARDVIFGINGAPVIEAEQALRAIAGYGKGDEIVFDVMRGGEPREVPVVLEEGWKADEEPAAEYYAGYLGMTLATWADADDARGIYEHPVITRVQSLGPAHRAHIASSQRGVGLRGPFVVSIQLDVKTVSGVVYDGEYVPVSTPEELTRIAGSAYRASRPLLLEIQLWGRENPVDLEQPLGHRATAFFRVDPALTTAFDPRAVDPAFDTADFRPRESRGRSPGPLAVSAYRP